jgi:hypothetical protein
MFDTVEAPGFAMVGPAFAGIAAALRAREPSKVRTAVRIVVVLPGCIAITMHAAWSSAGKRFHRVRLLTDVEKIAQK